MKHKKIRHDEFPQLVRALDEGTRDQQCEALRMLCPCRNRVYEREAWQKILRAIQDNNPKVRHQAAHAIGTLRQRAQQDPRSKELLSQLQNELEQVMRNPNSRELLFREARLPKRKIHQLSSVVRALDEGTSEEQIHALRLLCPCRNRIYDREVWQRIFRLSDEGTSAVRHEAKHAICTLQQRALIDPRSLELLSKLEQDIGTDLRSSTIGVAMWGPRNRPSRRKRMTRCKRGRMKAMASLHFSSLNQPAEELF